MGREIVRVWYDPEADFLEVLFSDEAGHMKATRHDAVMERVNQEGQLIGFTVTGVSRLRKGEPLEAELVAQ